jgi:sugar O-acyltransferase (sialic acid O-acetyltransferase NeuD family)
MVMKKIAIIGSGDLGEQIAYHAINENQFAVAGYFDDFAPKGVLKHGYPVLGGLNDILKNFQDKVFDQLFVAIGYKHFELRSAIFEKFDGLIPFATIIHSSSYVDKSCQINQGVIIYPGCILDMNVRIEANVLINSGCVIAHDTHIGKHSFLSPGVTMAGFINTGRRVSLGINTTVIDNINIADDIRTGGGAVVTKDLEIPGLYLGIPAILNKEL